MKNLFSSILDVATVFYDEQKCIDHLTKLRWPDGNIISPFDSESKVYRCKNNRYMCKSTNKYFNVRTGTVFEGTKLSLRQWFMALYLFGHKRGISSYQLATDLAITQKSAWFLLHRLRHIAAFADAKEPLGSENFVEADETFVGGKNKNRHRDKKFKSEGDRVWPDKTPVVGMLERGGRLIARAVPDTKLKTLHVVVKENVLPRATLFTDEWRGYSSLDDYFDHYYIDHSKGKHAEGVICTNGIENVWSHFKRMYHGTYYHIPKKHLQRYVDEFAFRFNSRKLGPEKQFNLMLSKSQGRLTYNQLIE